MLFGAVLGMIEPTRLIEFKGVVVETKIYY